MYIYIFFKKDRYKIGKPNFFYCSVNTFIHVFIVNMLSVFFTHWTFKSIWKCFFVCADDKKNNPLVITQMHDFNCPGSCVIAPGPALPNLVMVSTLFHAEDVHEIMLLTFCRRVSDNFFCHPFHCHTATSQIPPTRDDHIRLWKEVCGDRFG